MKTKKQLAIGHMKSDGRLDRNPLKSAPGDALHAVRRGAQHPSVAEPAEAFAACLRAIAPAWLGRSASDYRCQVALAVA